MFCAGDENTMNLVPVLLECVDGLCVSCGYGRVPDSMGGSISIVPDGSTGRFGFLVRFPFPARILECH